MAVSFIVSRALRSLAIGLLTIALTGPAAAAPSFPCRGKLTSTERAICADADLADLDRRMAREYAFQLSQQTTRSARKYLRTSQRQWLKERNRCGDSVPCIAAEYHQWIEQLVEWNL